MSRTDFFEGYQVTIQHRFPKLSPLLRSQLEAITPSVSGFEYYPLQLYPCRVRLRDETALDRVYVVSEAAYHHYWNVYPDQDSGKSEVRIEDVISLTESPSRLPAEFANELYRAGESGMGYVVFTVVFSKRFGVFPCRRGFATGNAVDFIDYPHGRGPKDVVAVVPHVGRRDKRYRSGPQYSWCLYSE